MDIQKIRAVLSSAEAVVVGAGAGLSTAAGLSFEGARFEDYFADFRERYGIKDIYSGGFYSFDTLEEFWAWWSRSILLNRYDAQTNEAYDLLRALLAEKDYFVLTTNVDHQFQLHGFDKTRLFYTQGDFGLLQCSHACHAETYDNEAMVRDMVARQEGMRVPSELIPYCPRCGAPMTTNLRCDASFVEDSGWHRARARYEDFLARYNEGAVVYLELGVGYNTPAIIKYPFWRRVVQNPDATYIAMNMKPFAVPDTVEEQSLFAWGDLYENLRLLVEG